MSAAPDNQPPSDPADRLQLVEERLSFQQKLIDDMHGELVAQQAEIGRQRREIHQLRDALERLAAAGPDGEDLPYEKPPHY